MHSGKATAQNAANRFRKTGIYPLGRHIFQDHEFARAELAKPALSVNKTSVAAWFHRSISVDEVMIRFDGRLAWKQYMPKKPVKWRIKLWCLCEEKTFNLDLGYRVVLRLMR